MANIDISTVVLFSKDGNQDSLFKLYEIFKQSNVGHRSEWIDDLFDLFPVRHNGYSQTRSSILSYGLFDKYGIMHITISIESRWYFDRTWLDELLETEEYNNITYYFCEEEPGCGIYINTDIDGNFLKERYKTEFYVTDKDGNGRWKTKYHESNESLVNYLNSINKAPIVLSPESDGLFSNEQLTMFTNALVLEDDYDKDNSQYFIHRFEYEDNSENIKW